LFTVHHDHATLESIEQQQHQMAFNDNNPEAMDGPASKRLKTTHGGEDGDQQLNGGASHDTALTSSSAVERRRGVAPIKSE
jgi:hypothetical protein